MSKQTNQNKSNFENGGDAPVTISAFARELNVCTKTVYRRIDEGEIPKPAKVGRCSRFARSVVDAYKRKIGLLPPNLGMS